MTETARVNVQEMREWVYDEFRAVVALLDVAEAAQKLVSAYSGRGSFVVAADDQHLHLLLDGLARLDFGGPQ